jgi:hypothetical protein
MICNEEHKNNNLDAILFIVCFSFFAFSFSAKSDCQSSCKLPYSLQYESVIEYHSDNINAVIADCIHLPSLTESCIEVLHDSNLNFCSEHFKISGYNRKISQSIKSFQKTRLEIEPVPVWRFYFHLSSFDREDPQFLS